MTNAEKTSARFILVPYPITPIAAFGYFILRQLKIPFSHVFYRYKSLSENQDYDRRICLFGPNLFQKLKIYIDSMDSVDRFLLHRMMNFCQSPQPKDKMKFDYFRHNLISTEGSPRQILDLWTNHFQSFIDSKIDPFLCPKLPFPHRESLQEITQVYKDETMMVSRPKYDDQKLDNRGRATIVSGSKELILHLGGIRDLARNHLAVGVFGPPGAGKSTFVQSLTDEVGRVINDLTARSGWEDFRLIVDQIDLDLGTPTGNAIREGRAQIGNLEKQPWTMEMAVRGVEILEEAKTKANLLFVDLPGKITEITEYIASPLDGGILILPSGQKGNRDTWGKFLDKTLGIERLGTMFSSRSGEGEESSPRSHNLGSVRGQIVGLSRTILTDDPFVLYLSKFLVFQLLPSIIERRRKQKNKFLL